MRRGNLIALFAMLAVLLIAWRYWPQPEPQAPSGPPLVKVTVPQLEAAAKSGETAFNNNCAVCHGLNAAGQDGVAPPLVHVIYEPNHHGDAAFIRAAKQGVRAHHWPFGDMPPVENVTDHEIGNIISYVRALQRANGIR